MEEESFFRPDIGGRIGGINQLREKATSDKSKSALKSSIQHFNNFLCQSTSKFRYIEELNEKQFCSIQLFKLFGSYLSDEVWSKGEQIQLMLKSALTYFSEIKTYASKKFPNNSLWLNEEWMKEIRKLIEIIICRRCIEDGNAITSKANKPIGRALLKLINEALYKKG